MMAVTCQHNDGNLLFPHPRPSPATTVFVFGTAARAGEGGRWPMAVPNADERGRTARGVPSEIEPPWSEPVGLVLTAKGEGLGYAPLCAPALRGPFTVVG